MTDPGMIDPIKLCCGQQHHGSLICPDGLVMCQLCFNRVPMTELADLDAMEGVKTDVCKACDEVATWT